MFILCAFSAAPTTIALIALAAIVLFRLWHAHRVRRANVPTQLLPSLAPLPPWPREKYATPLPPPGPLPSVDDELVGLFAGMTVSGPPPPRVTTEEHYLYGVKAYRISVSKLFKCDIEAGKDLRKYAIINHFSSAHYW